MIVKTAKTRIFAAFVTETPCLTDYSPSAQPCWLLDAALHHSKPIDPLLP